MLFCQLLGLALMAASAHSASPLRRSEPELEKMFHSFMTKYGKSYSSAQEQQRRQQIFAANVRQIDEQNRAESSWKKGVNQFADLTDDEFRTHYLNGYLKVSGGSVYSAAAKLAPPASTAVRVADLPKSVDWRKKNATTAPKDQGMCGSCWAFATVEQMESYLQIDTGDLEELSSQQITSCTPNPLQCGGTGGCDGAIPQLGYSYLQLFGLTTEKSYPYTSGGTFTTGQCKFDASTMPVHATLRGFESLARNDQAAVMEHLANKGPLAVAVDATSWSFYQSGVFDSCKFDKNIDLNHAVQLVGYGTDEADGDFWIVRNSWGREWGDGGYIRLRRTDQVECGTDSTPLHGVACQGDGQATQHVCGQCGILFDTNYPIGVAKAKPN